MFELQTAEPGVVLLAKNGRLDFESKPELRLQAWATDCQQQELQVSATLVIEVTDVNEPPRFATNIVTASVNAATADPAQPLTVVRASDPDTDLVWGSLRYFFASPFFQTTFRLTNNGTVYSQQPLTGLQGNFQSFVRVLDGGGLSDQMLLTLRIFGNNRLVFDGSMDIPEDTASGMLLGYVRLAPVEPATFALQAGSSGVALDPRTGALSLSASASLDFERAASVQASVAARLADGEILGITLGFSVTDVDEPPVFVHGPRREFTVAKTAIPGAVVGSVNASDPEGQAVTYSISGVQVPFNILANGTLVVGPNAAAVFETPRRAGYTFEIWALDPSNQRAVANVAVYLASDSAVGRDDGTGNATLVGVGAAMGVIVLMLLVIVVVWIVRRRHRNNSKPKPHQVDNPLFNVAQELDLDNAHELPHDHDSHLGSEYATLPPLQAHQCYHNDKATENEPSFQMQKKKPLRGSVPPPPYESACQAFSPPRPADSTDNVHHRERASPRLQLAGCAGSKALPPAPPTSARPTGRTQANPLFVPPTATLQNGSVTKKGLEITPPATPDLALAGQSSMDNPLFVHPESLREPVHVYDVPDRYGDDHVHTEPVYDVADVPDRDGDHGDGNDHVHTEPVYDVPDRDDVHGPTPTGRQVHHNPAYAPPLDGVGSSNA